MVMEKEDLKHIIHAQAQLIDFLQADRNKKTRELHNIKQVLDVKVKEAHRDFRKLEPKLAQNRKHILKVILDNIRYHPEGLTINRIRTLFTNRYGYTPTISNRTRELASPYCERCRKWWYGQPHLRICPKCQSPLLPPQIRKEKRNNRDYIFPILVKKGTEP